MLNKTTFSVNKLIYSNIYKPGTANIIPCTYVVIEFIYSSEHKHIIMQCILIDKLKGWADNKDNLEHIVL